MTKNQNVCAAGLLFLSNTTHHSGIPPFVSPYTIYWQNMAIAMSEWSLNASSLLQVSFLLLPFCHRYIFFHLCHLNIFLPPISPFFRTINTLHFLFSKCTHNLNNCIHCVWGWYKMCSRKWCVIGEPVGGASSWLSGRLMVCVIFCACFSWWRLFRLVKLFGEPGRC